MDITGHDLVTYKVTTATSNFLFVDLVKLPVHTHITSEYTLSLLQEVSLLFEGESEISASSCKVHVDYEYTAEQEDELTLKVGDIISNVKKEDGGWWEGELNGKVGMFPDNFVTEMKEPVEVKKTEKKEQRHSQHGAHITALQDKLGKGLALAGPQAQVKHRDDSSSRHHKRAKVAFSYSADNEDEISLEPGTTVEIIKEEEEGWYLGIAKGKQGLFPSNFVEVIEDETPTEIKEPPREHRPPPPTPDKEPQPEPEPEPAKPKKIQGVGLGNIFKEGPIKLRSTAGSAGNKKGEHKVIGADLEQKEDIPKKAESQPRPPSQPPPTLPPRTAKADLHPPNQPSLTRRSSLNQAKRENASGFSSCADAEIDQESNLSHDLFDDATVDQVGIISPPCSSDSASELSDVPMNLTPLSRTRETPPPKQTFRRRRSSSKKSSPEVSHEDEDVDRLVGSFSLVETEANKSCEEQFSNTLEPILERQECTTSGVQPKQVSRNTASMKTKKSTKFARCGAASRAPVARKRSAEPSFHQPEPLHSDKLKRTKRNSNAQEPQVKAQARNPRSNRLTPQLPSNFCQTTVSGMMQLGHGFVTPPVAQLKNYQRPADLRRLCFGGRGGGRHAKQRNHDCTNGSVSNPIRPTKITDSVRLIRRRYSKNRRLSSDDHLNRDQCMQFPEDFLNRECSSTEQLPSVELPDLNQIQRSSYDQQDNSPIGLLNDVLSLVLSTTRFDESSSKAFTTAAANVSPSNLVSTSTASNKVSGAGGQRQNLDVVRHVSEHAPDKGFPSHYGRPQSASPDSSYSDTKVDLRSHQKGSSPIFKGTVCSSVSIDSGNVSSSYDELRRILSSESSRSTLASFASLLGHACCGPSHGAVDTKDISVADDSTQTVSIDPQLSDEASLNLCDFLIQYICSKKEQRSSRSEELSSGQQPASSSILPNHQPDVNVSQKKFDVEDAMSWDDWLRLYAPSNQHCSSSGVSRHRDTPYPKLKSVGHLPVMSQSVCPPPCVTTCQQDHSHKPSAVQTEFLQSSSEPPLGSNDSSTSGCGLQQNVATATPKHSAVVLLDKLMENALSSNEGERKKKLEKIFSFPSIAHFLQSLSCKDISAPSCDDKVKSNSCCSTHNKDQDICQSSGQLFKSQNEKLAQNENSRNDPVINKCCELLLMAAPEPSKYNEPHSERGKISNTSHSLEHVSKSPLQTPECRIEETSERSCNNASFPHLVEQMSRSHIWKPKDHTDMTSDTLSSDRPSVIPSLALLFDQLSRCQLQNPPGQIDDVSDAVPPSEITASIPEVLSSQLQTSRGQNDITPDAPSSDRALSVPSFAHLFEQLSKSQLQTPHDQSDNKSDAPPSDRSSSVPSFAHLFEQLSSSELQTPQEQSEITPDAPLSDRISSVPSFAHLFEQLSSSELQTPQGQSKIRHDAPPSDSTFSIPSFAHLFEQFSRSQLQTSQDQSDITSDAPSSGRTSSIPSFAQMFEQLSGSKLQAHHDQSDKLSGVSHCDRTSNISNFAHLFEQLSKSQLQTPQNENDITPGAPPADRTSSVPSFAHMFEQLSGRQIQTPQDQSDITPDAPPSDRTSSVPSFAHMFEQLSRSQIQSPQDQNDTMPKAPSSCRSSSVPSLEHLFEQFSRSWTQTPQNRNDNMPEAPPPDRSSSVPSLAHLFEQLSRSQLQTTYDQTRDLSDAPPDRFSSIPSFAHLFEQISRRQFQTPEDQFNKSHDAHPSNRVSSIPSFAHLLEQLSRSQLQNPQDQSENVSDAPSPNRTSSVPRFADQLSQSARSIPSLFEQKPKCVEMHHEETSTSNLKPPTCEVKVGKSFMDFVRSFEQWLGNLQSGSSCQSTSLGEPAVKSKMKTNGKTSSLSSLAQLFSPQTLEVPKCDQKCGSMLGSSSVSSSNSHRVSGMMQTRTSPKYGNCEEKQRSMLQYQPGQLCSETPVRTQSIPNLTCSTEEVSKNSGTATTKRPVDKSCLKSAASSIPSFAHLFESSSGVDPGTASQQKVAVGNNKTEPVPQHPESIWSSAYSIASLLQQMFQQETSNQGCGVDALTDYKDRHENLPSLEVHDLYQRKSDEGAGIHQSAFSPMTIPLGSPVETQQSCHQQPASSIDVTSPSLNTNRNESVFDTHTCQTPADHGRPNKCSNQDVFCINDLTVPVYLWMLSRGGQLLASLGQGHDPKLPSFVLFFNIPPWMLANSFPFESFTHFSPVPSTTTQSEHCTNDIHSVSAHASQPSQSIPQADLLQFMHFVQLINLFTRHHSPSSPLTSRPVHQLPQDLQRSPIPQSSCSDKNVSRHSPVACAPIQASILKNESIVNSNLELRSTQSNVGVQNIKNTNQDTQPSVHHLSSYYSQHETSIENHVKKAPEKLKSMSPDVVKPAQCEVASIVQQLEAQSALSGSNLEEPPAQDRQRSRSSKCTSGASKLINERCSQDICDKVDENGAQKGCDNSAHEFKNQPSSSMFTKRQKVDGPDYSGSMVSGRLHGCGYKSQYINDAIYDDQMLAYLSPELDSPDEYDPSDTRNEAYFLGPTHKDLEECFKGIHKALGLPSDSEEDSPGEQKADLRAELEQFVGNCFKEEPLTEQLIEECSLTQDCMPNQQLLDSDMSKDDSWSCDLDGSDHVEMTVSYATKASKPQKMSPVRGFKKLTKKMSPSIHKFKKRFSPSGGWKMWAGKKLSKYKSMSPNKNWTISTEPQRLKIVSDSPTSKAKTLQQLQLHGEPSKKSQSLAIGTLSNCTEDKTAEDSDEMSSRTSSPTKKNRRFLSPPPNAGNVGSLMSSAFFGLEDSSSAQKLPYPVDNEFSKMVLKDKTVDSVSEKSEVSGQISETARRSPHNEFSSRPESYTTCSSIAGKAQSMSSQDHVAEHSFSCFTSNHSLSRPIVPASHFSSHDSLQWRCKASYEVPSISCGQDAYVHTSSSKQSFKQELANFLSRRELRPGLPNKDASAAKLHSTSLPRQPTDCSDISSFGHICNKYRNKTLPGRLVSASSEETPVDNEETTRLQMELLSTARNKMDNVLSQLSSAFHQMSESQMELPVQAVCRHTGSSKGKVEQPEQNGNNSNIYPSHSTDGANHVNVSSPDMIADGVFSPALCAVKENYMSDLSLSFDVGYNSSTYGAESCDEVVQNSKSNVQDPLLRTSDPQLLIDGLGNQNGVAMDTVDKLTVEESGLPMSERKIDGNVSSTSSGSIPENVEDSDHEVMYLDTCALLENEESPASSDGSSSAQTEYVRHEGWPNDSACQRTCSTPLEQMYQARPRAQSNVHLKNFLKIGAAHMFKTPSSEEKKASQWVTSIINSKNICESPVVRELSWDDYHDSPTFLSPLCQPSTGTEVPEPSNNPCDIKSVKGKPERERCATSEVEEVDSATEKCGGHDSSVNIDSFEEIFLDPCCYEISDIHYSSDVSINKDTNVPNEASPEAMSLCLANLDVNTQQYYSLASGSLSPSEPRVSLDSNEGSGVTKDDTVVEMDPPSDYCADVPSTEAMRKPLCTEDIICEGRKSMNDSDIFPQKAYMPATPSISRDISLDSKRSQSLERIQKHLDSIGEACATVADGSFSQDEGSLLVIHDFNELEKIVRTELDPKPFYDLENAKPLSEYDDTDRPMAQDVFTTDDVKRESLDSDTSSLVSTDTLIHNDRGLVDEGDMETEYYPYAKEYMDWYFPSTSASLEKLPTFDHDVENFSKLVSDKCNELEGESQSSTALETSCTSGESGGNVSGVKCNSDITFLLSPPFEDSSLMSSIAALVSELIEQASEDAARELGQRSGSEVAVEEELSVEVSILDSSAEDQLPTICPASGASTSFPKSAMFSDEELPAPEEEIRE